MSKLRVDYVVMFTLTERNVRMPRTSLNTALDTFS